MSTALLWMVVVLAFIVLVTVVAVEETRVHEAQRDAASWRRRACPHGGTTWRAYDGDEVER